MRQSLATLSLCIGMLGPAVAQPQGGIPTEFGSRDPAGAPISLRGMLYKPEGTPRGSVVLVHGSGGWTDFREGHYGRALSRAGYAVFAIDTFGPRGISDTVQDQSRLTNTQMTRDALAARRHLITLGHAPDRIAVMGFSKGGIVALYAADRTYLPDETDRFAVAILFYPGCSGRSREPKPASVVFMALGEKDDYTGVKPCQDLADDYARAGGSITVKVYPNATHGFDGNPALTQMIRLPLVENYMNCMVWVEPDGQQTYGDKKFPAADPAIYGELRRSCMKYGANIWTNVAQKEQATRDVIEFLGKTIGQ